ncbi:MAG: hypothetical protein ACI834_000344, partial [Colwellia sp.]
MICGNHNLVLRQKYYLALVVPSILVNLVFRIFDLTF